MPLGSPVGPITCVWHMQPGARDRKAATLSYKGHQLGEREDAGSQSVLLVCDVHCRRRWWWDWILSLWHLSPSCHPSLSCTFPDTLWAAPALPVDECLLWHDGTRHLELPVVPRHTFTVTASEVQVGSFTCRENVFLIIIKKKIETLSEQIN